jgi:hypothetical protein
MSPESRTVPALLATLLAAAPARAQQVEVSAGGVAVTNSEVDSIRQARGLGIAAGATMDRGRFRFEVRGLTASLRADFTVQPDYAVHQLGATASYAWGPGLRALVGIERRFVSPRFAAQEVGLVRVGILSETRLSRLALIHARADYFPIARFTGGGGAGLSLGLGIGARVGSATGRLHGLIEYSYERIDRAVNGASSPIKFSVARAGLGARL